MRPEGVVFDRAARALCDIRPIDRAVGGLMVERHYLRKWPGVTVLSLGLFSTDNAVGIIVYALPPRETCKRYGCNVWELARLWIDDCMPSNTESWFIAQSIRYIRKNRSDVEALVSYADPSQGHSGAIYKATNWRMDGKTDEGRKTPRCDYMCASTGKKYSRKSHIPSNVEIVRVPRISKHRFFYDLRS